MVVSMLAFGGEVLAFQCKSFSSKTRDHRKGSEVSIPHLSFDQTLQTFSVTDHKTHLIHKEETHIVHCASAFDVQLRQKVPCFLLKTCKKRTSAFKYMLYSTCASIGGKLHVEFALPYEIRDHISILQGPMLIWSHENSVFYASSQSGGVKEVPIPFKSIEFIGELPLHERKIVIQGTTSDPSDVKNTLYFIEDDRCDAACFVPNAYASVMQCMLVLSAEEDGGSFKSRVLAATSTKQLVRFENGFPRDVCALPYEHPLCLQTVHTLRNECLVAVSFGHGNVCAVWNDTFQVAWCMTGVCSLLVDDFLRCGSDQMLLVFQDQNSPGDLLRDFLLTDLCAVTYSSGGSDGAGLNTSDTAQDNFLLTVQALESRLQSGMNFLEDLQRDVEVKDRLILQSLVALTDLVSGREHVIFPPEQEGLVSLWEEDDDAGEEDDEDDGDEDDDDDEDDGDGMDTECAEALLKVDRVWQRVIGQSLIVGVVLKPTNNTSVMNMSVSVVDSGAAPVINTKILPFPESDVCVARGPTLALVAVTDVAPLLTSGCVKCPIMLHYSTKESSGSSRVSQFCGEISVDLKDISMGKFHPRLLQDSRLNTDEAREDLLSLTALLDSWLFLIECPDHTLADVQGFLHESLCVSVLDVDPRVIADPNDLRLFHWDQRSPFQALLSIQCMGDLRLLQFLHSLCDFLPASHHILYLETPRSRGPGPDLGRALETEISTVIQDLSFVLQCGERGMTGQQESDTQASEPLQRRREAWLRERGRSRARLRPLVDGSAYSALVERVIDRQLDADKVALMEAARL